MKFYLGILTEELAMIDFDFKRQDGFSFSEFSDRLDTKQKEKSRKASVKKENE